MIEIAENFHGDACGGAFCRGRAEKGEAVVTNFWNVKKGYWKVDFKIISADSKYLQAVLLLLGRGFKGSVYTCGKRVKKPKGAFACIAIWEYCNPREFSFYVENKEGDFGISNGLSSYNNLSGKTAEEPLGFCSRIVGGMAMIPVKKGEACFRMNCNDMEFDDDFSDLVFDVRFTETETKEEWEKLAKTPSAYEIKMYESPKPQ